jgi:Ca-activated chloride channel family protein
MSFLMPIFLWLTIPFVVFFIRGSKNITIRTHTLILILLLLSLARPIQKEVLQKANIDANDIVIAIDVSRSMQAEDISPTRYLFAKKTIGHLLSQNSKDNIMLIAFTSNPLLLSPPSTDHALILTALESLNPEYILTKGTSLKKLFTKLSSLPKTPKTLILITDGGEEKGLESIGSILNRSNISLITLALGTKRGTTILQKDGTMVKDKEGNLVVSQINHLLKDLTQYLNGTYLTASSTPLSTAQEINSLLKEHTQMQTIEKKQHNYKELYQIPLFIATLLFLLVHTRAVIYLVLFFAFMGLSTQASILDDYYLYSSYKSYKNRSYKEALDGLKKIKSVSLQSKILLANSHYKEKNYHRAILEYTSIKSTSSQIKQQIYYNTANAYMHLQKHNKAKAYYIKALQLGFDEDALHNLKLAMQLADEKSASLGIAHPKSQSAQTSKSESNKENEKREEDQPSSSSGSGEKEHSKEKQKKLISNETPQKHPLSSKVYELINKGYIHETKPW